MRGAALVRSFGRRDHAPDRAAGARRLARPWGVSFLTAFFAALLAGVAVVPGYMRAAALVVNAAGVEGWPHTLAGWEAGPFRTEAMMLPSRYGPLRARLYVPPGRPRGAFVLAPGVHEAGMEEARLVDFAGHLASRGYAVLTPDLADLRSYRITPRVTDAIEDAALWLATRRGMAEEGRVGIIGISFAGGLAVVAAGRPALRDRVSAVLSVGGHGDLPRTLRYLCSGELPDGTHRAPHDYGLAIVLLEVADQLVPPGQVDVLRNGVLTFLHASHVDATDRWRARPIFEEALQMERAMPEPAAGLLRLVNRRTVEALGPVLRPHVASRSADPALSPERSPAPRAPVFLLHGVSDNVIPTLESRLLARHLEGRTRVELLLTPLMTHAEARAAADLSELWKAVSFWAAVLQE